ncbi:hypothetical protein HanLR1_Chr17g0661811 [Helianthus annuus]|nr:hypothetical protein HanLR1_Chr17g0661811 [Helianthus annuus]
MEETEFALSFSCYSNDNITSRAVAKAIHEEEVAQLHENGDIYDEDFEFSLVLSDEESDSQAWTVFNHDITGSLGKLFISEQEDSSSYTSSETDESDSPRFKTKCKKSRSFGSESKRWICRYLLRRSNSERKEPMVKEDSPKQKRNSGRRWATHERFYVQRRAENEVEKRRSYLPYRKDLVNGMGKMIPF